MDYADDQTYEQSQTLQASRARGDFVCWSVMAPPLCLVPTHPMPATFIYPWQVSCYLNLALCATKQREAAEAIHYCNKALE